MLIREEDWNLDLVQAQFYCIQGPDNECLKSDFIDLRGIAQFLDFILFFWHFRAKEGIMLLCNL